MQSHSAAKGVATISIPTIDDNLVEPTETLVLNLQPGTTGLPITNIDNSINIKDNDTALVSIAVTKWIVRSARPIWVGMLLFFAVFAAAVLLGLAASLMG